MIIATIQKDDALKETTHRDICKITIKIRAKNNPQYDLKLG